MKYLDFLKKHHGKPGLDHVVDFLKANGFESKNINFSFEQAMLKANAWVEELNQVATSAGQVEVLEQVGSYKFVRLLDETSRQWEGYHLKHCVSGDGYANHELISLRDENRIPYCTIDVKGKEVLQIKGKRNGKVLSAQIPMVVNFLLKNNFVFLQYHLIFDLKNLNLFLLEKEVVSCLEESPLIYKHSENHHEFMFLNQPLKYKAETVPKVDLVELMIHAGNSTEEIKSFMGQGFGETLNNQLLSLSVEIRNRSLVQEFLKSGYPFRVTDETVLNHAIVNDDIVLIKELIGYGFKTLESAEKFVPEEIKKEYDSSQYVYSISEIQKKQILCRMISEDEFKRLIPQMCHYTVYEIFLKLIERGQENFARILLPEVLEGQLIRSMNQQTMLKHCVEYGFSELLKELFVKLVNHENNQLSISGQRNYYDRTLGCLIEIGDQGTLLQFMSIAGLDPKYEKRQNLNSYSRKWNNLKGLFLQTNLS